MGDGVRLEDMDNYQMVKYDLLDEASGVNWHTYGNRVRSVHLDVLVSTDYDGEAAGQEGMEVLLEGLNALGSAR